MRKRLRLTAILCCGLLLLAGVLLAIYRASQHVPAFYHVALEIDPGDSEKARCEMLQQATALASDLRKTGH